MKRISLLTLTILAAVAGFRLVAVGQAPEATINLRWTAPTAGSPPDVYSVECRTAPELAALDAAAWFTSSVVPAESLRVSGLPVQLGASQWRVTGANQARELVDGQLVPFGPWRWGPPSVPSVPVVLDSLPGQPGALVVNLVVR